MVERRRTAKPLNIWYHQLKLKKKCNKWYKQFNDIQQFSIIWWCKSFSEFHLVIIVADLNTPMLDKERYLYLYGCEIWGEMCASPHRRLYKPQQTMREAFSETDSKHRKNHEKFQRSRKLKKRRKGKSFWLENRSFCNWCTNIYHTSEHIFTTT